MCGIVGYIGHRQAQDLLIKGLQRLEYRGYDSAGVALVAEDGLVVRKQKGKVQGLAESLADTRLEGTLGIGHTRWATHGFPSDANAHPHTNTSGDFASLSGTDAYVELALEQTEFKAGAVVPLHRWRL